MALAVRHCRKRARDGITLIGHLFPVLEQMAQSQGSPAADGALAEPDVENEADVGQDRDEQNPGKRTAGRVTRENHAQDNTGREEKLEQNGRRSCKSHPEVLIDQTFEHGRRPSV